MIELNMKIVVISIFGVIQMLMMFAVYGFLEWEDRKKKKLAKKEEDNLFILHSVIDE